MYLLLFCIAFLSLFLISRMFTKELGFALMRLTRSNTLAIQLLALIFFPGVLIHELGHFLMASILFVPTGEIEFLPKVQEGGVKLGSVAIARTDPLRRLLIGLAPTVSGVGILLLASYYLGALWPLSWKTLLFCYILFEIGNTMFSSSKDLEGALGFLLFVGFLFACLFILGARIPQVVWQESIHIASLPIFLQISLWIVGSCVLNILLWGILRLTRKKYY